MTRLGLLEFIIITFPTGCMSNLGLLENSSSDISTDPVHFRQQKPKIKSGVLNLHLKMIISLRTFSLS